MRTWLINGETKIRAANWQMARFHARMQRIAIRSIVLHVTPAVARRQRLQAIRAYKAMVLAA